MILVFLEGGTGRTFVFGRDDVCVVAGGVGGVDLVFLDGGTGRNAFSFLFAALTLRISLRRLACSNF